ncbi:MAG: hypothetical protein NZ899_01435 [Thermoguttaceae bacterium]|nr:hypothetical protein [Thermoguttaceae bacterium]MDW8078596.1 hypothetical protein [Thermoguttaceae bacterium]
MGMGTNFPWEIVHAVDVGRVRLSLRRCGLLFPWVISVFCLVVYVTLCGNLALAGQPLAQHPENPRYFLWRGRPTILIGSGEHYGALLNTAFDFERYFAALEKDGLNHTRTFSGTYREVPGSFGITDNTLAPAPGYYLAPWARSDEPGYYDGGNKFDLTKFDPRYFERLRRFMACAGRHGVVVEFNLFCPLYDEELWRASPMNARNNINGIGNCPSTEVLTLKHPDLVEVQVAFVRRVVEALNEFDNFYFEVCNEPYVKNVPLDWQYKIIETIVETEKNLPNKHLISMNIANGSKRVENPHPAVGILNFHYCYPPDAVALNYDLNRVIGENETGFRGREDILYRTEAWEFILAGGGLFSHLDYSFTCQHPEGTFRDYRSPGGGSPELRKQLGILKRFIESFDFLRMKPCQDLIISRPEGFNLRILGQPGVTYAGYLAVSLPSRPKNLADHLRPNAQVSFGLKLPAGVYQLEWISPVTGESLAKTQLQAIEGGTSLETPRFDNDIAFRLVRVADN